MSACSHAPAALPAAAELKTSVYWGKVSGVPVYFIRPADWSACGIFKGGAIYRGSYDEREAYLYLCRAALEYLRASQQQPHIIQVHDWHAAATPLIYWEVSSSSCEGADGNNGGGPGGSQHGGMWGAHDAPLGCH